MTKKLSYMAKKCQQRKKMLSYMTGECVKRIYPYCPYLSKKILNFDPIICYLSYHTLKMFNELPILLLRYYTNSYVYSNKVDLQSLLYYAYDNKQYG